MAEDKRMKLLNRFMAMFEKIVKSDMPKEKKIACFEAIYLGFCTATGVEPNYELLKATEERL